MDARYVMLCYVTHAVQFTVSTSRFASFYRHFSNGNEFCILMSG